MFIIKKFNHLREEFKMFKKIWAWLDGNKMLIGTLLLLLVERGVFGDAGFLFAFMTWFSTGLAGGGFIHKIAKGISNTGK